MLGAGVAFSMDGRGRFLDNIFIERLWRSLKYEAVYLHELRDGLDAERNHRLVDRLLQRGAPAFVPGRADAGRGLPQWQGGGVNGGSPHVPGRALVKHRRGGEVWDLPVPRASLGSQPSPGRRSGCPPGDRGPILEPVLPLPGEDRRVEDPPQGNSQRMLPRALTTSRNPP